jgi:hypothetical protein
VRTESCLYPRTIDQTLADLRVKYATGPEPTLARMIQRLEAEIALREAGSKQKTTGLSD